MLSYPTPIKGFPGFKIVRVNGQKVPFKDVIYICYKKCRKVGNRGSGSFVPGGDEKQVKQGFLELLRRQGEQV